MMFLGRWITANRKEFRPKAVVPSDHSPRSPKVGVINLYKKIAALRAAPSPRHLIFADAKETCATACPRNQLGPLVLL
jgi:hypothetical protein